MNKKHECEVSWNIFFYVQTLDLIIFFLLIVNILYNLDLIGFFYEFSYFMSLS